MNRLALFAFAMLALVLLVSPAHAGGEINFFLGQKMLDKDDWEPTEDQQELGVQMSFAGKDWPIHIAIDVLASSDDTTFMGVDVDASTTEFDVGVRKIWNKGKARPFLGGGLASINGEIEIFGFGVDDSAIGWWVDGGAFWRLTGRFNLGVDVRVSRAEITLAGFDGEAGGEHIGLILGFGWPKR